MNVRRIYQPSQSPCDSCPYRRDVASGVWHETEYAKLPEFDKPTGEQPVYCFLCHQKNGRLCAGWVAVHDMNESLGLRLANSLGLIQPEDLDGILDYSTSTPLFASGQEAADHGRRDMETPTDEAVQTMRTISRKRKGRRL